MMNSAEENTDVLSFFDEYSTIINEALKLSYETNDAEEFLRLSELNKSFTTRKHLKNDISLHFSDVPQPLLDSINILAKTVQHYTTLLENGEQSDTYKEKIELAKNNYSQLINQLKKENKKFSNYLLNENTVTIQDIQKNVINTKSSFVEYSVWGNQLYTIVINKDDVQLYHRELPFDLGETIVGLNDAIVANNFDDFKAKSKLLYANLIEPIKESLKNEVVIVRDGSLHYLNFELLNNDKAKDFKTTNYFIKDYNVKYLLSATHQNLQANLSKQNIENQFGIFVPAFTRQTLAPRDEFSKRIENLTKQPFSLELANQLNKHKNARPYLNNQANRENFLNSINQFKFIHLATHAYFNDELPNESKIYFSPANDTTNIATFVKINELYNQKSKADLFVLLGCETGKGNLQNGEGVMSFAHAISYAGAKSQIFTNWKVDEQASNQIIEEFYESIFKGKKTSQALRQAKLDYLNNANEKLASPYYWAGMVLMGDNEITSSTQSSLPIWVYVLGIILIFLIAINLLKPKV